MSVQIVKEMGKVTKVHLKEYIGESTDIKPTDCDAGSTFFELDTGNGYLFDGVTWRLV